MRDEIILFIESILNLSIMQISLHSRDRHIPIYSPHYIRKLSYQINDRSRHLQISCHSERTSKHSDSTYQALNQKKLSEKTISQSLTHRVNRNNSKSNVPTQAQEYCDIINGKKYVLRLKHKIKDSSDPLPNLMEIKKCVQESRINFMRRMDCELSKKGNAYLLNNLRKDINFENRDYLKEMGVKIRKERRFLINLKKQDDRGEQIVFANRSPTTTKETMES